MTARVKDPTQATSCPSPLVLFGIDSNGKPKGARFGKQHAGLAIKAAGQLQLNVLASYDPKIAEIAARLHHGLVSACAQGVHREYAPPENASESVPTIRP